MVTELLISAAKYAPSAKWHVDTVLDIITTVSCRAVAEGETMGRGALTHSLTHSHDTHTHTPVFVQVLKEFILASLGSALIGVMFGLLGALALKHTELRTWPALELSILVIFAYMSGHCGRGGRV